MSTVTRRTAVKQMLAGAASLAVFPGVASLFPPGDDLPTGAQHAAMWRICRSFMNQFFAPALSVAIVRNSKFVYETPFGMADSKQFQQCSSTTLFRIASVSKPITSVAIFTLMEKGKLNLSDKVFGPSGILGGDYGKTYRQYLTDITVDHLLTHTCGGWPDDSTDPMFHDNSWDQKKLITSTLENLALTSPPGQHWAYSNFGYCVLGRVIEKITGQTYENFVQQSVLAPCGITDMLIAGNTYRQRAPQEAAYLGQFGENPYNMNVRRMDSHGGWIATASDLCRFVAHLGGTPTIPSILKPDSISLMTTPALAYPQDALAKYARGWMVQNDGKGNWWHGGSLPGTTSVIVRTSNGMCWAALTNTRTQPSETINAALDQMVWDVVHQLPSWNS